MRSLRLLILLLVLAAALLVALARPLPSRADEASTSTGTQSKKHTHRLRRHHMTRLPLGKRVGKYARKFIGVPYVWGGTSPRYGFDCSGFVRYVYGHFGISLPHSSFGDMWRGRRVLRKYLKPGDLVFFAGASHVGIYLGRNRMIDAPYTGAVVHITTMDGWYGEEYYGARRLAAYKPS